MPARSRIRLPLPRSLAGQVAFLLFLAGGIVFGVAALVEGRVHGDRIHAETVTRHGILFHHTIRAMLAAMGEKPPETVDEVLQGFADAPGVQTIRILDASGTIRHSSRPEEDGGRAAGFPAGRIEPGSLFIRYEEEGDRTYARIYEPIRNASRCRRCHGSQAVNGIMELRLDTTGERASLDEDRVTVLGILLGGQLALVAVVFVFFRSFIVPPLRRLAGSMDRVAAGELAHVEMIDRPEEFAALARQFNRMVDRLVEARRERDRYYEESLARAAQMATVGELATAMAHEIRNPLTGISGALQVLARDPALEPRRPIIREILATLDRLSKTVHDLLAYGRPSPPEMAPTHLGEVARGALSLLRRPAERGRNIEIVERYAPDLPPVLADAGQLRQIVLNVLLNAVQAQPEGGRIEIETRLVERPGGAPVARLSIRDHGPGVPEDLVCRIFAPFFTTKPKGTGLGLAICQRLAEENGGELQARNAEGGGLVVMLDLPIAGGEGGPPAGGG